MIGDLGIEPQPAEWSGRAVVLRRLSWHPVWQPKRGKWSISPASAMRAPKLIELLNSKVSLRLKPGERMESQPSEVAIWVTAPGGQSRVMKSPLRSDLRYSRRSARSVAVRIGMRGSPRNDIASAPGQKEHTRNFATAVTAIAKAEEENFQSPDGAASRGTFASFFSRTPRSCEPTC